MIRIPRKRNTRKQTSMPIQRLVHVESPSYAIPQYVGNSIVSRCFRFVYAYGGGPQVYTITPAKLCSLQVIGTVVNTTAAQIYEAARLRKVEMWANGGSSGTMQLSCVFSGTTLGIAGPNQVVSDSSIGMTVPAHVVAKPSRNSQASQWQSGDTNVGTNTLFVLTFANTGTIGAIVAVTIDIHVSLRMTGNARTSNNTVALTTVALGAFYNLALDNPAGGTGSVTSDLVPDRSLVTTT